MSQEKNKSTLIVILIIIGIVLIVGLSIIFGWKYIKSKFSSLANPNQTSSQISSSKMKSLVELFKYPDSTITTLKYNTAPKNSSVLNMETEDSQETVYDYYSDMITVNSWASSQELKTKNSWLTVNEADFNATISITNKNNKTIIETVIESDNEEEISSRIKPTSSPTAQTTSSLKSGTLPTNSYIISDSNTRLISESELTSLTSWQLKVARNEIYARHGRPFVHKDLQCYFATQSWYQIDYAFSNSMLSVIENKNVETIKNYEEKINSPLKSSDSGC